MQRNGFGVRLEKQCTNLNPFFFHSRETQTGIISLPSLHFQSNHINYAATLQWTCSKNHKSELFTDSKSKYQTLKTISTYLSSNT